MQQSELNQLMQDAAADAVSTQKRNINKRWMAILTT